MPKLAYKTKLIVADEDKPRLLAVLQEEQKAWNAVSKIIFRKRYRQIVPVHRDFYANYIKHRDIPSQILCEAERQCLAAYRSAYKNKHKITKPFVRKKLTVQFDVRSCSIRNQKVYLCSLEKRKQIECDFVRFPKLQHLLDNYKFAPPKVSFDGTDFWCSLSFSVPEPPPTETAATGYDMGFTNIVASSGGVLYKDKKYLKEKRRLRYLKRWLKAKGTKSARKHHRRIRHKEHNHTRNFVHHLTNRVLADCKTDTLIFENLNVKPLKAKNRKGKRKTKSVKHTGNNTQGKQNLASQIPMSLFLFVITYKALMLGKHVKTVSPAYTSKTDHRTGKRDGTRKGSRYYCKDGKVMHADVNAACNIALRSQLPCSIGNYYTGQAVIQPANRLSVNLGH